MSEALEPTSVPPSNPSEEEQALLDARAEQLRDPRFDPDKINPKEEEFGPYTGQPQIEQQPAHIAENTEEQIAAFEANEELAAKEATLPAWRVVIQGDDALWEARPGQNHAREDTDLVLEIDGEVVHSQPYAAGDPMPWVSPAKATVEVRAKNDKQAAMAALRANVDYHTVISVEQID